MISEEDKKPVVAPVPQVNVVAHALRQKSIEQQMLETLLRIEELLKARGVPNNNTKRK